MPVPPVPPVHVVPVSQYCALGSAPAGALTVTLICRIVVWALAATGTSKANTRMHTEAARTDRAFIVIARMFQTPFLICISRMRFRNFQPFNDWNDPILALTNLPAGDPLTMFVI